MDLKSIIDGIKDWSGYRTKERRMDINNEKIKISKEYTKINHEIKVLEARESHLMERHTAVLTELAGKLEERKVIEDGLKDIMDNIIKK